LGLDPARIAEIPAALAVGPTGRRPAPPLWDGRAAERVADVVDGLLSGLFAASLSSDDHGPVRAGVAS
jgi:hypothetical protein